MELIITDYHSHERDIRRVRDQVFVIEQQISPAEELDERDAICLHALVYEAEQPIGTGRLDVAKGGKIGRLAVLAPYRRRGVGSLIMNNLVETAARQGLKRIWFHAQLSAVPFYKKLGYQPAGLEFIEAGIPHVLMERSLVR